MRALVVGGTDGRALELAASLGSEGHAVRVVVADADGPQADAVRAVGAEPWVGTPDRIGTLRYGLENVTIVLWLQADADPERAELHGTRLRMMLEKVTDTTVRGAVYETGGPHTEAGVAEMEHALRTNEIHFRTVARDEADWLGAVRGAIDELLAVDRMGGNPYRS